MRLFFSVEIEKNEIRRRIEKIQEDFNFKGVKLVAPENLHTTMKFIGEVSESELITISDVAKKVRFSSSTVSFTGLGTFPRKGPTRILWVGIIDLESVLKGISAQLNDLLVEANIPKDKRSFTPHLTIGRVKSLRPKDKHLFLSKAQIHKETVFGEDLVSSFKLIRSTLTPKGPIYETLFDYKGV